MKILKYKIQLATVLHIVFWMISFNIFNSFFSRGVESGYTLDGLDLSWSEIFLISNIILIILLLPLIWFINRIKRWIKIIASGITLVFLGWCILRMIQPNEDNIVMALLIGYFYDNFLYVFVFHITIIAAVYLNIKILIKKFLEKGKFGLYLLSAIALAAIAGVMNFALFDYFIDLIFPQLFYISWFRIWELILIMAGYMAITTIVFLLGQYGLMLIANREKAQNELSALKAQINPHFLFNNLNTIYALAVKGDLRTKDVILQLSDFLRYVLYDTTSEKIQLEKEVEIIKTYVGLQRERINPSITDIILRIEGDFTGAMIAPLLLLPLAENCFKHGIGQTKGTIQIDIRHCDGQLLFHTKNRIALRENPMNQEKGGIGIINVEKRLNLLYPDQHLLTFTEDGDLFEVEMKINLD